jgi:superfamily I DNA/RNA helicase
MTQGPESPRALADRHQRRAVHTEASVWVSASAGSGKTKVLTDRVLSLLLDGNEPQKILCLTWSCGSSPVNRRPRSGSNAPSVFSRRCSIPRGV